MGGIISGAGQIVTGGMGMVQETENNWKEYDATAAHDMHGAADALQRGAIESGRLRSMGSDMIARQQVGYANSGVDPTIGTAANVQAGTAAAAELDAQTAKNNAAAEAWGFDQHRAQAYDQLKAKNDESIRKGVGSILGGGGQMLQSAMSFA